MSGKKTLRKTDMWTVAGGFVIAAIVSVVLSVPWFMILGPMSYYALLVIKEVTVIYCIVWLLAVGFFLRKDPIQYIGAALFVVVAVVGTTTIVKLDNMAKRNAEIELVSRLKTSRIIERPLSKVKTIAIEYTESQAACLNAGMCQRLLMHGLTDQATVFRKMGGTYKDNFDDRKWKLYLIRLREKPGCRLQREDFGKLSIFTEAHRKFRNSCFERTSFTKTGNLYELIENATLLKTGRNQIYETVETLPRVTTAIAKQVEGGKIVGELARWDYKRSHILGKEFGSEFNSHDFVRALFGMAPLKR